MLFTSTSQKLNLCHHRKNTYYKLEVSLILSSDFIIRNLKKINQILFYYYSFLFYFISSERVIKNKSELKKFW